MHYFLLLSFQGGRRGQMFMEHGMSCLVYNYRVDFTGGGSPPFGNVGLCGDLTQCH